MTDVELYQGPPEKRRDWLELLEPAAQLANTVAETEFVPNSLRRNPAAITAAVLYGDELGLGPMQSLAKVHVVDGRPALAAEVQRALVLEAGHDLWLVRSSSDAVTWAGARKERPDRPTEVTWTMDDARRAGLDGRQNWRKYPRAMLSARASAELIRALFPDVIAGLPATEELEDGDRLVEDTTPTDPGETGDPAPKKVKKTAKKATKAKAPKARPSGPGPALPTAPPRKATPAKTETGPPPPAGDEPPPPDDDGPRLPFPNLYAMRATDAGLDDVERHALTRLITAGRTERSADLDAGERTAALDYVEKVKAGTRKLTLAEDGARWLLLKKVNGEVIVDLEVPVEDAGEPAEDAGEPAEPGTGSDGPETPSGPETAVEDAIEVPTITDEAALMRFARSKGVKLADLLKKAGEGLTAASAPKSAQAVIDNPDRLALVVDWLVELP